MWKLKLVAVRLLTIWTVLVGQSTPASVSGSVTPSSGISNLLPRKIDSQMLTLTLNNSLVDNSGDLGDSSEDGQYYDDDAGVTFVTDEDVMYEENSPTPSPFASSSNSYDGNFNPHFNLNPAFGHSIPVQFQVHSNLRQEQGDEWSDGRCPPFPEIPTSSQSHRELCEGRRCSRDSDCISSSGSVSGSGTSPSSSSSSSSGSSSDASLICCYNGCIHSCQHTIDPPLAFDWLEETELMTWRNTTDYDEYPTPAPVATTTSRTARSRSPSPTKEPRGGGGGGQKMRKKTLLGADVGRETIALPGGCFLNSIQYENLRQFRKHEHVQSCTCSEGDVVCEVNVEKDRLPNSSLTQFSGLVPKITLANARN